MQKAITDLFSFFVLLSALSACAGRQEPRIIVERQDIEEVIPSLPAGAPSDAVDEVIEPERAENSVPEPAVTSPSPSSVPAPIPPAPPPTSTLSSPAVSRGLISLPSETVAHMVMSSKPRIEGTAITLNPNAPTYRIEFTYFNARRVIVSGCGDPREFGSAHSEAFVEPVCPWTPGQEIVVAVEGEGTWRASEVYTIGCSAPELALRLRDAASAEREETLTYSGEVQRTCRILKGSSDGGWEPFVEARGPWVQSLQIKNQGDGCDEGPVVNFGDEAMTVEAGQATIYQDLRHSHECSRPVLTAADYDGSRYTTMAENPEHLGYAAEMTVGEAQDWQCEMAWNDPCDKLGPFEGSCERSGDWHFAGRQTLTVPIRMKNIRDVEAVCRGPFDSGPTAIDRELGTAEREVESALRAHLGGYEESEFSLTVSGNFNSVSCEVRYWGYDGRTTRFGGTELVTFGKNCDDYTGGPASHTLRGGI